MRASKRAGEGANPAGSLDEGSFGADTFKVGASFASIRVEPREHSLSSLSGDEGLFLLFFKEVIICRRNLLWLIL